MAKSKHTNLALLLTRLKFTDAERAELLRRMQAMPKPPAPKRRSGKNRYSTTYLQ